MSGRHVVAATGLRFEAAIARRLNGVVACCGQGPLLAGRLRAALTPDCLGLVSFGIAGGLDPRLRSGQAIVAASVRFAGREFQADPAWTTRLLARYPSALQAPLLSAEIPVLSPAGKARLFGETGAAAIDMESGLAAEIAAAHGLPFACFRVIADAADRAVPGSALKGLRVDGSTDAWAVMSGLRRSPGDLPMLLRLAWDSWRAKRVLARAAGLFGGGFGLLDLG
jgi:hopanoid-associated phosphorylase